MNFNDTINSMGYSISERDKDNGTILIEHDRNDSSIFIFFDNKKKIIDGWLTPKMIKTETEMKRVINRFAELQSDLMEFSKLSNFKIINH